MSRRTAELRRSQPDAWAAATRPPFVDGVRDGSLPVETFDAWLAQDALFVEHLLGYQARLLARAPRAAQHVLAAGAVALVAELDWFDDLAAARGLDLAVAPTAGTAAYLALLDRLEAAEAHVGLAALWALERVYLEAWAAAAPGAAAYADAVGHWTAPGFAAYVDQLAVAVDAVDAVDTVDAVAGADAAVERAVAEVLRHEAAFWPGP